jgi:hypothetical protein
LVDNVDPNGVVVVPASCVAASLHLVTGAHAHAGVVAHLHGLLIGDAKVAAFVSASVGGLKLDTAFETVGLATVTVNGAAPHVSDTGGAEVSQRMLAFLRIISNAAVNCVTWA